MSGEFERIDAMRTVLERSLSDVTVGIGDDAAVLAPSDASQILTVDAMVEGVHFRRAWASWADLGRRAFVAAASDVAAMGGRGRCALVALVLPDSIDDEALMELTKGIAAAADECKAPVVGGNLAKGSDLSITTTVIGELDGAPMQRRGARAGDGIYVTGQVGAPGLGLALLLREKDPDDPRHAPFVERWRRPTARLTEGQRLRATATACVDVSDGVLADLGHLCEASEVGARIYAESLPLPRGFRELAKELDEDPVALALTAGEDYQLLFTAPASMVADELATRIGEVRPLADGVSVIGTDGEPLALSRRGWEHF